MTPKHVAVFIFLTFFSLQCTSQRLSGKANDFLNALDPELRSQALFSLADDERLNMNYVPIERRGPTFHDFNDKQKQAALDLLKASLSAQGYQKSTEIMELESVLFMIENNSSQKPTGKNYRDPLNYHLCVFGKPSPTEFWGWRFEGHHISLNFTSASGKIVSSTPSFFGSNPAIVPIKEQHGKQVLKLETELGFTLVNSLSKAQLKIAKFAEEAPREIITGNTHKVAAMSLTGIPFSSLSNDQKKIFTRLLHVYIDNYEPGFAKTFMDKIDKAGIQKLHFAWAGSLKPGVGHYYRIQGPTLLIEYDNTQNNANHVHTVVRDLTNDFGEDLLREHYKSAHHHN